MKRSVRSALGCASVLAVAAVLLTGCTKGVEATRPKPDAERAASETLKTLHNKLVYVVARTTTSTSDAYSLYWVDPVEKSPHLLLTSPRPVTEVLTTFFLPGREKMLVHMAVSGNTRTGNDYVARLDGSSPSLLVRGHVADVFPDGKRLLVSSDLSEGSQSYFLYTADTSGRILKRLTRRPTGIERKIGPDYLYEGDSRGVVSPDGRTIVYDTSWYAQGTGSNDVIRINSDGSDPTRLTHGTKTKTAYGVEDFSHDGSRVAVMETRGYGTDREVVSLALMDIDGHIVHRFFVGDEGGFSFGGFSPTDDRMAVVTAGYRIDLIDVREGTGDMIVRVDETAGENITSVAWLE